MHNGLTVNEGKLGAHNDEANHVPKSKGYDLSKELIDLTKKRDQPKTWLEEDSDGNLEKE